MTHNATTSIRTRDRLDEGDNIDRASRRGDGRSVAGDTYYDLEEWAKDVPYMRVGLMPWRDKPMPEQAPKLPTIEQLTAANPSLVTTREAALRVGRHPKTVQDWCRFGHLKQTKMRARGMRIVSLVSIDDLERVVAAMRLRNRRGSAA